MIKFMRKPVLLVKPIPVRGSFMVKCGELRIAVRADFIFDRESAKAAESFIDAYRGLFHEDARGPSGSAISIQELRFHPGPPPPAPPEGINILETIDCTDVNLQQKTGVFPRIWNWVRSAFR